MGKLAMPQLLGALRLEGPVRLWLPRNERKWHVLFTVDGKFFNRSTGFEEKEAAERKAAEIFASVVRAPADARTQVTLQDVSTKLDFLLSLIGSTGGAASLVAPAASVPATVPDRLFTETLHSFLDEKSHVSPWHLRDLKESNTMLGKHLARIGILLVREVTGTHLVDWLKAGEWTGKTYNRRLNSVANFFNWCAKRGYIESNPALSVDRRRTPKHGIPETIAPDRCRALMSKLETNHPEWVIFYALALFGGLRADKSNGEILRLFDAIAKEGWNKFITPRFLWVPGKDGNLRKTRMPENLWAWLSAYKNKGMEAPHRCSHTRLAKELGLPKNSLRHTAISAFISAGGSMAEAALTFGTSEQTIRRYYADIWEEADGKAFWQIMPSIHLPSDLPGQAIPKTEIGERDAA